VFLTYHMTVDSNTSRAVTGDGVGEGTDSSSAETPLDGQQEVGTEEVEPSESRISETATEEESKDSEPPEGSLEAILQEPEPLSFERKPKHRDIRPEDFEKTPEGGYVIKDQGLYGDFVEIFGNDKTPMNLNRFLTIKKAKPAKGDAIAEIAGFEDGDMMAHMIRKLGRASKANDQEKVREIQADYPDWVFDFDQAVPFTAKLTPETSQPTTVKHPSQLPWSNSELDSAVNAYCAEKGIMKTELMRNPELTSKLKEFSALEISGNPIPAHQALSYAISQVGTQGQTDSVSGIGGAQNASINPPKDPHFVQSDFDEYNQSLSEIGCSPIAKETYVSQKKQGLL